jgi:cell division protein FtsZ
MSILPSEAGGLANKALSIRVFGVGGAGGNALTRLLLNPPGDAPLTVLNTDSQALAACPVPDKHSLGALDMRGLGAGGDPAMGQAAAEADEQRLKEMCAGADLVFIVAGLGGGTGTGASPVLARIAREAGALVLAVVTLPFDCEGSRRRKQALLGLEHLKAEADGVICLPNQKVFKLIDENTSLVDTFEFTNELIADGVRGIWRLVTQTGLINIDFADLRSALKGRHAESFFATAEATGPQRAKEIVDKILSSPLLEGGEMLTGAQSVLVSIMGGSDLSMAEVNRIMEQVNRHAEGAHLILGAAIDAHYNQRLSVTLVASRFQVDAPATPDTIETRRSVAADAPEMETHFLKRQETVQHTQRFVAPPPELSAEKTQELLQARGVTGGGRRRKNANAFQQQLPLEVVSKGRFEKSEPTIHKGEDLDVPTYIRRGILLN